MDGSEIGIVVSLVHLGLLAAWSGSMAYSLMIVQPRLAKALTEDDDLLEHLSIVLGAGNRRPVLALIAGLFVTGAAIVLVRDLPAVGLTLLATETVLLAMAAVLFATVSWRLWPRRVFALPEERPAHRRALRHRALAMTTLVGTSFILAAVVAQL